MIGVGSYRIEGEKTGEDTFEELNSTPVVVHTIKL